MYIKQTLQMFFLLAMIACSRKGTQVPSENITVNPSPTQCATGVNSLSSCDMDVTLFSDKFYSEVEKVVQLGQSYVVLTNDIIWEKPEDETVPLAQAQNVFVTNSLVVVDPREKSKKVLLDRDDIEDFTVANNSIYILREDEKGRLKLNVFDTNFTLIFNEYLKDPEVGTDKCEKNGANVHCRWEKFDSDLKKKWREQQLLALPKGGFFRHYDMERLANIAVSDDGSSVHVFAETAPQSSGNYYHYQYKNNKLDLTVRKQIIPNISALRGLPIGLIGGSEIFGFNRFAKKLRRFLTLTQENELILQANFAPIMSIGEFNETYASMPQIIEAVKMHEEGSIEYEKTFLAFNEFHHLILINPKDGSFKAKAIMDAGNDDSVVLPLVRSGGDIYLFSSQVDPLVSVSDSLAFSSYIHKIDGISFERIKSLKLQGPLSIKDFQNYIVLGAWTDQKGDFLLTGRMGWKQNPNGQSITPEGEMFVAILKPGKHVLQEERFSMTPRKEVGKALFPYDDGWLLFYEYDGPYTHSGDADFSQAYQKVGYSVISLDDAS